MQDGPDQSRLCLSRSGMHGQVGRFVDDGEMVVLVDDRQLNLNRRFDRTRCSRIDSDQLAEAQLVGRPLERAVDAYETIIDELSGLCAGGAVESPSEKLVEAFAVLVGHQFQRRRCMFCHGERGLRLIRSLNRSAITMAATPTLIAASATLNAGK